MTDTRLVDVAILGAGTAGLNARRGAQSVGASAVLIDPGPFGTTCARVGCMPSKLLVAPAEAAHKARLGAQFGFDAPVTVDRKRVMDRVRSERDRFVAFVNEDLAELRAAGELIVARGEVIDGHTVQAGDTTVCAKALVVATGSRPWVPPAYAALGAEVLLDNAGLFELEELPESVLVVGLGVIGLELGQALHRLGVRTTLLGQGGRVGPFSDPALQRAASDHFSSVLDLHPNAVLRSVERVEEGARVRFVSSSGEERHETFSRVLVATGRRPVLDGFGLERLGLPRDASGRLCWDPQTTQVGDTPVFLAGDASNHRTLLHEASDEGRIAGANAGSHPAVTAAVRRTPLAVVFVDPQMAIVGDAWDLHSCAMHAAGTVHFTNQGRARVMLENHGMARIYGRRSDGRIRGAEVLGPAAEHMGHLLAWAIQAGLTVDQALAMPFYHPTVEEGLRTALRDLRTNLRAPPARGVACAEFSSGS